jgi:hypothetical protein
MIIKSPGRRPTGQTYDKPPDELPKDTTPGERPTAPDDPPF